MIYVYDILLNWSDDRLYDFFEWEKTDKLEHIKRIPLFKVEKNIINKFMYNNIKIEQSFINKIYNITEVYTAKKVLKIPYAFIMTDGITSLAVKTDKLGNVKYRSKLIVDEESEIICISSKLSKTCFEYKAGNVINEELFITRNELKIKNYLLNIINKAYKNKEYNKLKYLYKEYSKKNNDDIDAIYNELTNSLSNSLNQKHINLYNIFNMSTNKN